MSVVWTSSHHMLEQNLMCSSSPASRSWWGVAVRWGSRWAGSGGGLSHTCRCSGSRRQSQRWTAPWRLCEASGTAGSSCCQSRLECLLCDRLRRAESPGRSAPAAGGGGAGEQAGRWGLSQRSGCLRNTTTPGIAGKRRPKRGRWKGTRPHPSLLVTSVATLSAPGCKHKSNALRVVDLRSLPDIGPYAICIFIFLTYISDIWSHKN